MRIVLQRVSSARVVVEGEVVGAISQGYVAYVGVGREDDHQLLAALADKIADLRLFPDARGRFDRSLRDIEGEILVVSQFTLWADLRKGRRPSFHLAADPGPARELYEAFVDEMKSRGVVVATGRFGADMKVESVGEGPVTLYLDSDEFRRGEAGSRKGA